MSQTYDLTELGGTTELVNGDSPEHLLLNHDKTISNQLHLYFEDAPNSGIQFLPEEGAALLKVLMQLFPLDALGSA